MTDLELRAAIIRALQHIAPEIDPATLLPNVDLRQQVDIDSMDFLNFVVELHRTLGVDVPEADYAQVGTLDGAVAYLAPKLGTPQTA